jgi:hypothetical protein
METILRYLEKHALSSPQRIELPAPDAALKCCIVIPCLAELGNIDRVLSSLERGSNRLCEAEVLVVINNPTGADQVTLSNNLETLKELRHRPMESLSVHALDYASPGASLPPGQAGVGLARRLGMDLALQRLLESGNAAQGIVACLDADSPVEPGYVDSLLKSFAGDHPPLGAICSYEHPIPDDPALAQAIIAYELWMRYFELGLLLAKSPFSYPTIGSCLVASARGYALADGMPPRQAGEDHYFLQKLAKVSGPKPIGRIRTTVVRPEARISKRVPFGTGRAICRCLEEGPHCYLSAEPPVAFFDLRRFFSAFEEGFSNLEFLRSAASSHLLAFLETDRAWPILSSIRRNHTHPSRFALALHQWFDGLRIVRYAHACERSFGRTWIFDALAEVLEALGFSSWTSHLPRPEPPVPDLRLQREWLECLRANQR